jgi:hypothetical protein
MTIDYKIPIDILKERLLEINGELIRPLAGSWLILNS